MARVPGQRALVAGSGAVLVGVSGGAGDQPGGIALLVEIAQVSVLPAQAIVMLGTALGTFVAHRSFTFRRPRNSSDQPVAGGDWPWALDWSLGREGRGAGANCARTWLSGASGLWDRRLPRSSRRMRRVFCVRLVICTPLYRMR